MEFIKASNMQPHPNSNEEEKNHSLFVNDTLSSKELAEADMKEKFKDLSPKSRRKELNKVYCK